MSEKTLGKARGLNSIADPSDFKGTRGSGRRRGSGSGEGDTTPDTSPQITQTPPISSPEHTQSSTVSPAGRDEGRSVGDSESSIAGRKRRELSIPLPVAEALAETGINPADIVMSAYRTYADSIYAGSGGRLVSRGRERLRLSVSDGDFDKITRLGKARGWNRSETVAVLLTLELLGDPAST